jgi:diguanylate cyclase (GGDEF)-like protein
MEEFTNQVKSSANSSFLQYKYNTSVGVIRIFIVIIAAFNLFLVIPDMTNIQNSGGQLMAILLRCGFVLIALALFAFMKKIQTFHMLALVVSGCELLSALVFFRIFYLYESPNYMIQVMGLFIMIMAFYFIPNRWGYMLGVSVISAVGFIICSYLFSHEFQPMELTAGTVYLAVEIALCATFTRYLEQYRRREYDARIELQRIYSTDPLTQVGNRIRLEDEAEKWIEFCSRHGLDLSLVLIDVDNLKQINDKYGHLIGDVILYELAQIMHTQLRKNDVCTRWGGDEFVLLLPSTSAEEAARIICRIRQAISEKNFSIDIPITCSFGITSMTKGHDLEQMIYQADKSMYAAKKGGKNSIAMLMSGVKL